jgi:ELWxxDGT repeat protein
MFSTLIQAEEVIQTQKDVSCEESYALATPGSLTAGSSSTVDVDIPTSSWFIGRYTFTPEFTGALTISFSGGSKTTAWWVGTQCASRDGGSEYLRAIDTATHTQTINVTAGEKVYITAYDWYQAADIKMVFSRFKSRITAVENIIKNDPFLSGKNVNQIEDLVYFIGNDSVHGEQLWISDGTVEGTHMITSPSPYITQTQRNVSCEESYSLESYDYYYRSIEASFLVDIPEGNWYLGRYHIIAADYSADLTLSFHGGSDTTTWWVGTECGSHNLITATNTASHTQTIRVTPGEPVYITVFDWHQAKDIRIDITSSSSFEREESLSIVDIKKFNDNLFFSLNSASDATAYKTNLRTNETVSLYDYYGDALHAESTSATYSYISDKYAVMEISEVGMDDFEHYVYAIKHDISDPVIARVLSMDQYYIGTMYIIKNVKETEEGLYIHGVHYDDDKEVCVFFNGDKEFTKEETMIENKGDELEKRYDTACGKNGDFEI